MPLRAARTPVTVQGVAKMTANMRRKTVLCGAERGRNPTAACGGIREGDVSLNARQVQTK